MPRLRNDLVEKFEHDAKDEYNLWMQANNNGSVDARACYKPLEKVCIQELRDSARTIVGYLRENELKEVCGAREA